jgi:hypothetical protein
MPLDCYESADLWREAHASSKRPTNPTRIARIINEEHRQDQLSDAPPQPVCKHLFNPAERASESALNTAVMNSRRAADEVWRLLHESMIEGRPSKIQVLVNIHNKAVEAHLKAESAYREELERQRILIPLSEAKSMVSRVVGVIVSRLSTLPQNMAARCNLIDPQMTLSILEDECVAILKDAQRAL